MKNYLILICLFISLTVNAQVSSVEEVQTVVNNLSISSVEDLKSELLKKGITLEQAQELAEIRGLDFNLFLKKYLNLDFKIDTNNPEDNSSLPEIRSDIGFNSKTNINTKSLRFGAYFFNNPNISESPSLFLATPSDYRLGPGDELVVNLFGALENSYNLVISKEGTVKFDRIPPVYLSGLSINQAKLRVKSNLSKLYSGLYSNEKIDKVDLDLSLSKARSIVVNIVGNVNTPGTYTISGFSSILNALYLAGGPNEIGTYRNIKLIRSGENISTVDLYDYFSKGVYPSLYLRDQDVIFVEPYKKNINLESGFKINGIFEIKNNESIANLLDFSGGFQTYADNEKIFVESQQGLRKKFSQVLKKSFNDVELFDGDIITAKIPKDYFENVVSINGEVILPGKFSLDANKTISELLNSSGGFTKSAFKKEATLFRYNDGLLNEVISLDLNDDLNFELRSSDQVFIYNNEKLSSPESVRIIGNVKNPTKIDFNKNLTLTSALLLADGFLPDTDINNIEIYSNRTQNNSILKSVKKIYSVDEFFQTEEPVFLKPYDVINVNKIKFQQNLKSFYVAGEVADPGSRIIENSNLNTSSFFENLILNKEASLINSYLVRDSISIPIFSKNKNLSLKIIENDSIVIPKINNTIKVRGAVNNEVIITYEKNVNLQKSIYSAGGFTANADKKSVYVRSLNSETKAIKKFLFFRINPIIKEGDEIIVPEKEVSEKVSVSEVLGISSVLTSLVALIRIITN